MEGGSPPCSTSSSRCRSDDTAFLAASPFCCFFPFPMETVADKGFDRLFGGLCLPLLFLLLLALRGSQIQLRREAASTTNCALSELRQPTANCLKLNPGRLRTSRSATESSSSAAAAAAVMVFVCGELSAGSYRIRDGVRIRDLLC